MIRKKYYFTLLELLVVTAILALLFAILLPALSKSKHEASRIQCQSNLKQWGNAFSFYIGDYNLFLPYVYSSYCNNDSNFVWTATVGSYMIKNMYVSKIGCPIFIDRTKYAMQIGYGMNEYMNIKLISSMTQSSKTMLLSELYGRTSVSVSDLTRNGIFYPPIVGTTPLGIGFWHMIGKNNSLYIDMHVSSIKYSDYPRTASVSYYLFWQGKL